MKINKIAVVGNTITITVDLYPNSGKPIIFLDSVDNSNNKYSLEEDKHDIIVTKHEHSGDVITIDIALLPEMDLSAFTVYIDGVVGFYYNDKELYYKQVDLLVLYCDGCLDKEQKENLVVYMMRYNMLQHAITNELLEDQINLYKDIARLIGIDTKHNQVMCSGKCKRVNGNCKNGVCKLC